MDPPFFSRAPAEGQGTSLPATAEDETELPPPVNLSFYDPCASDDLSASLEDEYGSYLKNSHASGVATELDPTSNKTFVSYSSSVFGMCVGTTTQPDAQGIKPNKNPVGKFMDALSSIERRSFAKEKKGRGKLLKYTCKDEKCCAELRFLSTYRNVADILWGLLYLYCEGRTVERPPS